jgi:hypothetical protein
MTEAVGSAGWATNGRIRTVSAEVYAPSGARVMTFAHAMEPPRPPTISAAQAATLDTFLAW